MASATISKWILTLYIHIGYTLYMYFLVYTQRCEYISFFFSARKWLVQSFSRCLSSGLFLSLSRLYTFIHNHCNFLASKRTTRCSLTKFARTQTAYKMRFGRANFVCVCVWGAA